MPNNGRAMRGTVTATIPINTALSNAIFVEGWTFMKVITPAEWTGANIGFKVSTTEAGTYNVLRNESAAIVQIADIATAAANCYTAPAEYAGCRWIKLWSKNTASEADVNQAAARVLLLELTA